MKKVGLDTNIFMGVFLEEKEKLEKSLAILNLISHGILEGIISVVSLIEIAVLFYQKNEEQKGRKAIGLIKALPNTTIVDITTDLALDFARLKVTEKIFVADAAVLSAAIELSADVFLTYDSDFANVKQIRCLKPEDYLKTLGR